MSLEAMGKGLKARLETIADLKRVYAPHELPNSVHQLPVALILPGETLYNQTMANATQVTFRVLILLSRADQPSALNRMLDYIDPTGTDSVYAAIEGDDSLGGATDFTLLRSNTGVGQTQWGGQFYISTEFRVECQKA